KNNRDPTAVGVVKNLVGAVAALDGEAVADQGGNHLACRQVAQQRVINTHQSDGDGYARFDGNLHFVGGLVRNMLAMFSHAFNDHADDIVDVLQRFSFGFTPR